MKRKILLFSIIALFGFLLAACGDKSHNIKVEEVEPTIKWTEIEILFSVTGEDDKNKITEGTLQGVLYKGGEVQTTRLATKTTDDKYKVLYTTLELDTEYELVITASINQKKVELFKEKYKTLLDGGDESNPLIINSVEDFKKINNQYAFYKLGADLDFEGEELPYVFNSATDRVTGLRGGFDGNGHKISNFKVPTKDFTGIFGNMSSGTASVKNLTISDVTFSNEDNVNNKVLTTLYFGFLTREMGVSTKVSNITFKNIDFTIFTETYGIRYFGLVTGTNGGKIEDITFENVNVTVIDNNTNEGQIGGMVGKLRSTGKVERVYYESGDFNILRAAHTSNPQTIYPLYIGTVVGEGSGLINEAVSKATINVIDRNFNKETQRLLLVEGNYTTIKVANLAENFKYQEKSFINKNEAVEIKVTPPTEEDLKALIVNGVDRKDDLVNNVLTIPAGDENIHVQAIFKVKDLTKKLKLTGSNFDLIVDGSVVPTKDIPEDWNYNDEITIKGKSTFGTINVIKLNGIPQVITDDKVTFKIERDTKVEVFFSSSKAVYVGGIAGGISEITNSVFAGGILHDAVIPYIYREKIVIGGVAASLYKKAAGVSVFNLALSSNNSSEFRTVTINRLFSDVRFGTNLEKVFSVLSTIHLNGTPFDDGATIVDELIKENYTEYIYQKLID